MRRSLSTLIGMEAGTRTRTSLAAAALLVLLAGLLLPGCAPHRRGQLPVSDVASASPSEPASDPTPSPARESIIPPPARDRPAPPIKWQDIDRTQPQSDQVCDMAQSFRGVPYVYGGTTPKGFDCSGLVQFVFREVGVTLPRTARHQSRSGRAVTLRTMLRGDLIFFRIDRDIISHVGIYTGRGEFIHAPGTGKHIRTDSIDNPWWRQRVKSVRRVLAG